VPDWPSKVDQLVAEDDIVAERFHASGTHRGDLMGVPGTGRALVLHAINIFRIDGDYIIERWGQLTNSACSANSNPATRARTRSPRSPECSGRCQWCSRCW